MWVRVGASMIDPALAERVHAAPAWRCGTVDLFQLFDLAFCEGPQITVRFDDATVTRDQALRMIERVRTIGMADRAAFEPMLWAFYTCEITDGLDNFGTTEEQFAWELDMDPSKTFAGATPATCPSEVWPLIQCGLMFISNENGTLMAQVGGPAAWDAEHGCTFTFDEQGRLLKVGDW